MNDWLPDIPVWQAPTGSIAGVELCAAVSRAGGIGSMGMTWEAEEEGARKIEAVRRITDKPFMCNFALAFAPKCLDNVLNAGAPIVCFSWGDAAPYAKRVKNADAILGVQVTNVDGMKRAADIGAEFVICQSVEAGGHVQSTTSMDTLLPKILDAAGDIPVIAAGGVSTGTRIAELIRLGAAGVMCGTRFVASVESLAHAEYKRRLVEAEAEDAALTMCFQDGWQGAPHRVLRNSTMETWEAYGSPSVGNRPGEGDKLAVNGHGEPILRYEDTAPRVGMEGEIEAMCCYAGMGVGNIQSILPASEILLQLWKEALETSN